MRPSSTVLTSRWTDEGGRHLRAIGRDAMLVAVYLETCANSNPYGLFLLPFVTLAQELAFEESREELRGILKGLGHAKVAYYHPDEQWVWVKKLAQTHFAPTGRPLARGDNRVRGVQKWYDDLPDNPYLSHFYDYYGRMFFLRERRVWSRHAPTVLLEPGEVAYGTPPEPNEDGEFALTPYQPGVRAIDGVGLTQQQLFDEWWRHYPRHKQQGRREALEQWRRIKPTPDRAFVTMAVQTLRWQAQTLDWLKEGGKFVPKPANYLKQGRYQDTVEAEAPRYIPEGDIDHARTLAEWAQGGGDSEA